MCFRFDRTDCFVFLLTGQTIIRFNRLLLSSCCLVNRCLRLVLRALGLVLDRFNRFNRCLTGFTFGCYVGTAFGCLDGCLRIALRCVYLRNGCCFLFIR